MPGPPAKQIPPLAPLTSQTGVAQSGTADFETRLKSLRRAAPSIPAVRVEHWLFWEKVKSGSTQFIEPEGYAAPAQQAAELVLQSSGYQCPILYFYIGKVWTVPKHQVQEYRRIATADGVEEPLIGLPVTFAREEYLQWTGCVTHFDTGAIFPRTAGLPPHIAIQGMSPEDYLKASILDNADSWENVMLEFIAYYFAKPAHYFDDNAPVHMDPESTFAQGNWRAWAWELKRSGNTSLPARIDLNKATIPFLASVEQRRALRRNPNMLKATQNSMLNPVPAVAYKKALQETMAGLL